MKRILTFIVLFLCFSSYNKTITIINASNQTITVNRSTNSITASIADTGQGIQSVTGNTFSVLKGGVADVIYTDASSVVVFGSGVVNA